VRTIKEIRKALYAIHHVATGQSDRAYMSVPARPDHDADLILSAAIDELAKLRVRCETMKRDRDNHAEAAINAEEELSQTQRRMAEVTFQNKVMVAALRHIARGNISPSINYARTKLAEMGLDWKTDTTLTEDDVHAASFHVPPKE
jgi:hypothetical protein